METGARFIPHGVFVGLFIPNAIAEYQGLKMSSKLVWGKLAQFAGSNGVCFPRIATVARELGSSERTIQRSINELVEENFLEIEKVFDEDTGSQKSNRYHFLWHEIFNTALTRNDGGPGGRQNGTPEGDKKSSLGVTDTPLPPGDNLTPKENYSSEQNQEETTTPVTQQRTGICSGFLDNKIPEEILQAIDVVSPSKEKPRAYSIWAKREYLKGKDGTFDVASLLVEAHEIRERLSAAKSLRKRLEEEAKREATEKQKTAEKAAENRGKAKEIVSGLIEKYGVEFVIEDVADKSRWLINGSLAFGKKWHKMTYQETRSLLLELCPDEAAVLPITPTRL